MKKPLLLCMCYMFPFIALAQQFKAGLIAGIATTQVDGDTYAGYNKLGFVAGGFVTKNFSAYSGGQYRKSKWSASFEITYVQKGSRKIPHPDKGDYSFYKLNLNYAEVPFLVRYSFIGTDSAGEKKSKFQIEGGIAVGALVQFWEEDKNGQVTGGVPFEKFDVSTVLGLTYLISDNLFFNARYEYSALPVRRGPVLQYYQNWTHRFLKPGYYNNVLLFSFRYQF